MGLFNSPFREQFAGCIKPPNNHHLAHVQAAGFQAEPSIANQLHADLPTETCSRRIGDGSFSLFTGVISMLSNVGGKACPSSCC